MEIDSYPKKKKVGYTSHPNFPSVSALLYTLAAFQITRLKPTLVSNTTTHREQWWHYILCMRERKRERNSPRNRATVYIDGRKSRRIVSPLVNFGSTGNSHYVRANQRWNVSGARRRFNNPACLLDEPRKGPAPREILEQRLWASFISQEGPCGDSTPL